MNIDLDKIFGSLLYNPNDRLLFNSSFFLFFFAIVLCIYQFLYKRKLTRVVFFTLFSLYFFYKCCGWYVSFILIAAVVDFNLSNWIYRARGKAARNGLLVFSIIINLGLLAWFKYTDLFIDTINELNLGHIQPLKLAIPIGISFYTFENLSYTIDVYRGKFRPVTSFLDYCFFLSFFPKLVMGPIVRASDFIPQIRQDIVVTKEDVAHGLYLIIGGLIKKVVISDYINVNFVQYVFDDPTRHSGIECLFAVYGYAMVIYCDFSGYSDMAIGMAKWMGFTININFDSPYKSASITEFWRRWHISLSSWLRDYLYISLGGNRKGKFRQYVNLMVTMLLGGLWHGASWNFVLWGGMHGAALAFDKMRIEISEKWRAARGIARGATLGRTYFLFRILGVLLTFHFVCFCWIFFKAKSFDDSSTILYQIFHNFNGSAFLNMMKGYSPVFIIMGIGYLLHFVPVAGERAFERTLARIGIVGRIAVILLVIWIAIQVKQAEPVMPIYLQF
jgi:D-alanyl-lipoteichoic acid acyltransferase DltB (MBOAT superfamily)